MKREIPQARSTNWAQLVTQVVGVGGSIFEALIDRVVFEIASGSVEDSHKTPPSPPPPLISKRTRSSLVVRRSSVVK